jgi:hypothetical protein
MMGPWLGPAASDAAPVYPRATESGRGVARGSRRDRRRG